MQRVESFLSTKLSPPRPQRRVLHRPALIARLGEAADQRLTIVQAGTGYGKTTALASLGGGIPLVWYSVEAGDADPRQFLTYLINAFRLRLPALSDAPLAALQELDGPVEGEPGARVIDALINALDHTLAGPALLAIDDYHFAAGAPAIDELMRRFVSYLPADLHVILATRHPLGWPELVRWRARGELAEISREIFAFRPGEIEALFRTAYGLDLSPAEIAALADKTEGWPIALQLVWQGLRDNPARNVADVLAQGPASQGALFEYLAEDVLGRLPDEVAAFLRATAVLHELTPDACDAVRDERRPRTLGQDRDSGETDDSEPLVLGRSSLVSSAAMLARLHELDLFVVALGERHYRYHHLFHDFLRAQAAADPAATRERHRRAAAFFGAQGDDAAAIGHWLSAADTAQAAAAIERAGEAALRAGQVDTVAQWIDALPPLDLVNYPRLQAFLGDIARLRSRFDIALEWYAQAERTWRARDDTAGISRALRGQANIYLDTVRPAEAERLLEEALRLSDGTADRAHRARLLELLAENKLNLGHPTEADTLRMQARALREEGPGEDALSVRVKLRTGQLDEAQQILEGWASTERLDAERGQLHPPRSHRETVLLLALIHAMRGRAGAALELAQEGIALGDRLESPFITAVAHIRLGHAHQIQRGASPSRPPDEAIRRYQMSIALGDRLAVRRLRAEAMWGLTRAYGFFGDLASARSAAAEGVETSRWAGDHWMEALTRLALGASCVLAGAPDEAADVLGQVLVAFRECGDSFGRAATRLWLCLAYHDLGQRERQAASADDLLTLCAAHGYDFLFTGPALAAPPDPHRVVPILLDARDRRSAYAARLLAALGLPDIQIHPGYQLRVQTLGAFRVWRGDAEIEPRAWQRDKARQLFQLLLTQRGRWLQRDEIIERLWPNHSAEAAVRDFKVALSVLNKVLEPGRTSDAPFAFVAREGTAYRLRPEADLRIDAEAFARACESGLRLVDGGMAGHAIERLRTAVRLYSGDYLPDALYEDWASEDRERLLTLYLRAADRLASALVDNGQFDEAIGLCQSILVRDPCWERAYCAMMLAYARQGNRPQALRTYQRCAAVLDEELGVEPSAATAALHTRIVQAGDGDIEAI